MEWWERLNAALVEKGWSVPDLAREMGSPNDQALIDRIYKWTGGSVENPRGVAIPQMAKALGMSEIELRTGQKLTTPQRNSGDSANVVPNATIGGPVSNFGRIPIRGQGMGGKDGALIFNTDQNLGDVLAPPMLVNVPNAYAVYVIGDSMLERFRAGEVVYVHPYLPVRKDDDCVVQIAMGDGEQPTGWIKRFVSRDSQWLKVRQLNPKKVLRFPVSRVISCHRIVFNGSA